ncbi:uncharacterized protein LOC107763042 isoform X1 [Nicotiana tabacum]|uniref:Uncharacterized protein isoform X1 n=3 Tax=Nicotiana tabacum TaxID=4097 RepID=A0A1S3XAI0_TOBAC|nr:PREDICTED: uncharacterized protein LOC107763042 isoform X1 [Nicotiana tabacum]XP_016436939.1 PREDICTED: uncharacterized protein LOC107763042 isoform X1 [Nicotiana tabacum]XP_016436940.1 PREDICTED: uncharacterized protein LOC107763042 isoform X1 [Nicotiana tabacum]XP_016436942.1 PREDICTED: uncharacterized protein LOC107763042 isoform X1 [Nicotiana tabacum]XP_016436943.1 PREDICTED: uncharacterized protein LOC107763042 isoform X1 [Nicotiana tabacum]XP_016436944.1 PREDICTED: uncharacterized pro
MENSHIGALNPLQNPFPFPPHRRRPLMSQTYITLLQILSYNCPTTDSTTEIQKPDDNGSKLGKENEVEELVDHHLIRSDNLLVNGPAHKESDNLVVQQGSGDGNEGSSRSGYRDFTSAQMEVDLDLSNRTSDAIQGDRGHARTNDIDDMNRLVDKTRSFNDQMVEEPGNRCSTHESEVKESDPVGPVELDKELSIDDVCATIESCFGADTVAELSQPAEVSGEEIPVPMTHLTEEMEHGLRLKEMELETLISSAGATDLSVHVPMGEEIEKGEVSGDFMVFDESDYDIVNDVRDEKKVEAEKYPADIVDREDFAFDARDNPPQKRDAYASSSIDAVDEDYTSLGGKFIRKFGEEPKDNVEKVFCSKDVGTRKVRVYDSILDSGNVAKQVGGDMKLDHPAGFQFGATSAEKAKENKHLIDAAEDADIGKKKKKGGPLTKEKRAKKKAKERIKRAEKNRKLGVKRLKLPPVVKPKVVAYCRHYLKGRCSEGEKCKFSHDTTPLTKSKPCCHFARQSCMKGDDCPFDHQLSKYPCNNYASIGFCSRGADCLFSHEITVKMAAVTSPTASNLELMSPSAPSNSNSLMQINTYGVSHKDVNSSSGSAGFVPGKCTERTVLEPVQKPAACTPKGVTFLSHGKSLQGDARKHEKAGLSSKADDVGKLSCQMIHNKHEKAGLMKGVSPRTPQGINFLSFGQAPSAEPSGDTYSGLFNMDYGVKKLLPGGMNNSIEAATCAKRDGSVKDDNQANLSASLWSMNQMSTRTPHASAPRGISFLSAEKAAQDISRPNEFNRASSPIQRRPSAAEKTSDEMPFRQSSSLFPAGQSLNYQSAQKCSMGIASSSKTPFLANTQPSSIQKALQSTLAFAAKFDLGVKFGTSNGSTNITSSINHSKDR